jgi:hypothetical protein
MRREGLFPTTYLRCLLSQRAAAPGERLCLRVEGTDAASLTRGKAITFERQAADEWEYLGTVLGARSRNGSSSWTPKGSGAFMTLEGYRGTMPLFFDVPPVQHGEYRIRLDLTHSSHGIGDVQARTATLYAFLLVLPDVRASES